MLCVCCGRKDTFEAEYSEMHDDRYGNPLACSIVKCSNCGMLETNPRLSASDLPALYSTYYPRKSADLTSLAKQKDSDAPHHTRLLSYLLGTNNVGHLLAKPGQTVLDFGCGDCATLIALEKSGAIAYGVETDPNVASIAERFGLKVHVGAFSKETFTDVAFDLIILNQVIEHIPEPAELLELLKARLKPDGTIFLSFPNSDSIYRKVFGRSWINWHLPYHLHHFSYETFKRFCARHGLHIVKARFVTPNVWTMIQMLHSRVPERVGIASPVWSPTPKPPSGLKKKPRLAYFPSRFAKVVLFGALSIVNRIVDLCGKGDSLAVLVKPKSQAHP